MTDAVTERDEAIAERLIAGDSVRAVVRQFGCSTVEVHAVVDRAFEIDNEVRRRMVLTDTAKLDRLLAVFYEKAIKEKDTQSALVSVRIWERKHELLGLNSPQRLDIVQLEPKEASQGFDRIYETIMRLSAEVPPIQQALRKRLKELDPEVALALLNGGDGGVEPH